MAFINLKEILENAVQLTPLVGNNVISVFTEALDNFLGQSSDRSRSGLNNEKSTETKPSAIKFMGGKLSKALDNCFV